MWQREGGRHLGARRGGAGDRAPYEPLVGLQLDSAVLERSGRPSPSDSETARVKAIREVEPSTETLRTLLPLDRRGGRHAIVRPIHLRSHPRFRGPEHGASPVDRCRMACDDAVPEAKTALISKIDPKTPVLILQWG